MWVTITPCTSATPVPTWARPSESASNASSVFHPVSTMYGPRSVSNTYTKTYRSELLGIGTGTLHSPGRTRSTGGSGLRWRAATDMRESFAEPGSARPGRDDLVDGRPGRDERDGVLEHRLGVVAREAGDGVDGDDDAIAEVGRFDAHPHHAEVHRDAGRDDSRHAEVAQPRVEARAREG